MLQPKSVGYIELATKNPRDHPIIEPRYLSHPDDVQVLVEAWKFCDRVAATKSLSCILQTPLHDDSVKLPPGSDEYLIYKIKRDVITVSFEDDDHQPEKLTSRNFIIVIIIKKIQIYHPTGTCKMGPDSDPMSVLDPKTLGVRKVTNLRIADCSAFPDIPAANTNLPAIMIGERCADMIAFGGL